MPSWNKHRGSRHAASAAKRTALGFAAVAALSVLGAAIVWAVIRGKEQDALSADTFCPKAGPIAVTAVLIDRTDGLTAIQVEALKSRFDAWAHAIPKYGALVVYDVGDGDELLDPVLSLCNPGDGSDQSALDSNKKMWAQRYEEKFATPVHALIENMRFDTEAASSPILEAVQAIAVRDFGPQRSGMPKRLIIVSDLLQHTSAVNFYKKVPDPGEFRRTAFGRSVAVDLSGVMVDIYFLNRMDAAMKQTNALGAFWMHWLRDLGGSPTFSIIPG
jgi:hypothetical protein